MIPLVWDMESNDPDDFLTLLLLLGHPAVDLRAITITPGSARQVGLVRAAMRWLGRDIPVGAGNLDHPKDCVSDWHFAAFGKVQPSREAEPAGELLCRACDESTTLLCGGPLKNLGAAMRQDDGTRFRLGRLVVQGGFAGEGVVPPEHQLPQFRGRMTCPTFNLNGDVRSALLALTFPGIGVRRFVSKNVCHGVVYDAEIHRIVGRVKDRSPSLAMLWKGMDHYLRKEPAGKKFHDPLAACCAIDESIGKWAEVELFREKGEWGSRLKPGSGTWIITEYSRSRFLETLTATPVESQG